MRILIGWFFLVCLTVGAGAHPHVWLQARTQLLLDEHNHLVAIKQVWQFDEGFSAYATQGLDVNGDGVLNREELAELAQINVESLKEFEYFTFVQMGKDDPAYAAPKDYWLEHKEGLLTLNFTLPMEKPVVMDPVTGYKDLTVEVFDATFFVDVSFVADQDMPVSLARTDGAPSGCTLSLERPKELDPTQSQLLSQIGPNETIPDALAPQAGDLSNTIRINCPLA